MKEHIERLMRLITSDGITVTEDLIIRAILPDWAKQRSPGYKKVIEGQLSDSKIEELNSEGYNIYYLPNTPSKYDNSTIVDGSHIDQFDWVFVDMDLKENKYKTKEEFLEKLSIFLSPTIVVDSGNGVHAYWKVSDLDAMSYLKIQRRLIKFFNTDESLAKIYQLMRLPGTFNTKVQDNPKECKLLDNNSNTYTCEQLDKALPPLSLEDDQYCQRHYNITYRVEEPAAVNEALPPKFGKFLSEITEAKALWLSEQEDRSKADYRLGHLMFAYGFTKEEATSVLINTPKALARSSVHRISYAQNIVDKIWTFELSSQKSAPTLSQSVKDILAKGENVIKGTRFPCWNYLDATAHGFRLGQVVGLVGGSGIGKTAIALNMFMGFVKNNPDYIHFFIPLEQPPNEVADRWRTMCQRDSSLYEKVHILGNYDDDGNFRHLSLDDIKEYLLQFQKTTGNKIGAVVIDHIGALRKKGKDGENQDLMSICHSMKAFAVQTNTLLIMQSQAPREKAGIGDLELDKDAAYGTVYFESYCDYLITLWQPLKRCYSDPACPTVTAFKFCKIRHKKKGLDSINEDVPYRLFFDPTTETLRELTQREEDIFKFWLTQATNKRKLDKKNDLVEYESLTWTKKKDAENNTDKNTR